MAQRAQSALSLAPGFSRVCCDGAWFSRFNGFPGGEKPLKRFGHRSSVNTRLKPGANERGTRLVSAQLEGGA
jgi:hypothetical protein